MSETPVFYVLVQPAGKGEAERVDASLQVLSLEFLDNEKTADVLTLTVDNFDLSNFDNPIFKTGNTLIASWGYPGRMSPARECVIQKVTGSTTITVTAQAKSVLMNKTTKSKSYENTTRSEIVFAIAKEYGFGLDKCDITETTHVYETILQAGLTDAQFVKRLADLEHFEFFVDFDGFHWHPRRLGQRPLRKLQYFLPPDVGDILSFNVENDIFAKPAQVVAKGRDPLKKADVSGEGSNAKTERDALSQMVEMVDPKTGLSTLQVSTGGSDLRTTNETTADGAKRAADGAYKRSVATTVKLTMELVGDPLIVAKSVIDVRGISKRLSGLYYITEARHRLDSGGYKLSLKAQTDGTNGHSEDIVGSTKSSNVGPGRSGEASVEACRRELEAKRAEAQQLLQRGDRAGADRATAEARVLAQRCAALEAAASKATPNPGAADAADPGALSQSTRVDPKTGLEYVQFEDNAGRDRDGKR